MHILGTRVHLRLVALGPSSRTPGRWQSVTGSEKIPSWHDSNHFKPITSTKPRKIVCLCSSILTQILIEWIKMWCLTNKQGFKQQQRGYHQAKGCCSCDSKWKQPVLSLQCLTTWVYLKICYPGIPNSEDRGMKNMGIKPTRDQSCPPKHLFENTLYPKHRNAQE